jgi:shikimate kinase
MVTFKQFVSESIEDKGIFKAIFVIGLPGAGKSYTISKLKGTVSPAVVNTDRASEYLGRKIKRVVTSDDWELYFKDKTHRMTKLALRNYINAMLPLFIDGTSNDASQILHRMGILESLGYDIGIIFVDASLEKSMQRAKEREEKIGRVVDEDYIKFVHSQNRENAQFLKTKVGFFTKIPNDSDEIDDDVMLKAFKATQAFFTSKINNPVGRRAIDDIKEGKSKYLVPLVVSDSELDSKVAGWYK